MEQRRFLVKVISATRETPQRQVHEAPGSKKVDQSRKSLPQRYLQDPAVLKRGQAHFWLAYDGPLTSLSYGCGSYCACPKTFWLELTPEMILTIVLIVDQKCLLSHSG
jgi:hypothetical protein